MSGTWDRGGVTGLLWLGVVDARVHPRRYLGPQL
jgi:hypothetical protein